MIKSVFAAMAIATMMFGAASAHDSAGGTVSRVKLVYEHILPNVPGKSIKGVLVEYSPGGFSQAHSHPASAFHLCNGAGRLDP